MRREVLLYSFGLVALSHQFRGSRERGEVVGIAGLRSPYDARIRAMLDFQIQK
jgi:hypothetical protein